MMSRFVSNYLGVNTVNPGQPQHPQQPHHGLPINLATLNQQHQQHQPPQNQSQQQQQQQSLQQQQQQQQQQTQHQMKNPSHSEHYSTPVMGQVQVQQTQQPMHGPNPTTQHYRIMGQPAPPPTAVYQQNAGPMQGPPQSQQGQQQQQITTTTIRGIPPSSSTPPQQPDVLGKMGQQPSHYQMQQIQQPQQQQSAPQQSRNGSYRPQSNINNRNRMNPQQPPLYFPYTQQFVMPPIRHPSFTGPQFQQLYYYPTIPPVSQRAGTPASNLVQQTPNITTSAQPTPHISEMYPSYEMYQPIIGTNTPIPPPTTNPPAPKKEKLRPNAIAIINPDTNRNVVLDFLNEPSASSNAPSNASSSGVSSSGSANTSAVSANDSNASSGSNPDNTTVQQASTSSQNDSDVNISPENIAVAGQQQPSLQHPPQQQQAPQQQVPVQKREHQPQIRMQQPPPPQYVHPMDYNPNKQQQPQQMRENSQGRETMHPHHPAQSHQPIFDSVPVYQQPPPQIPYQHQTDLSQQSQTPVVSAISDGPSVDITPKHGSKKKNKLNEHAAQNENLNKQHPHSVVSHNQVPPPAQPKQHPHHPQQIPQQPQQINYNKNKQQSQQQPILPPPNLQQHIPLIQQPQQAIKVDSYKPASAPIVGKESTIPQIPQKTQKEIEESDLDNNNIELANAVEATTEEFASKLKLNEEDNKKNNNFIENKEPQQAPSVDVAVEQKNKINDDIKAQESSIELEEKSQIPVVEESKSKVAPESDETDRAVQMGPPAPVVDIVKQQIDLKNNNQMSTSTEKVEIQLPREEAKADITTPIVVEKITASVDAKAKSIEASSAAESILNYQPDQWSPLNYDGKKYYTRDQLLVLKDQPISKHKPQLSGIVESLFKPNINTLRKTLESDMLEIVQNDQLMKGNRLPNIHELRMSSIEPKFGLNTRPNYQKRPSNHGNKPILPQRASGSGPPINIRLSLKEDVKLNEAEVAWKPTHLSPEERERMAAGEADKQTQDLYKKFRSVLNKLTPDNFTVLMKQVKLLDISTEEQLNGCIKLVFEKAISEPNFATAYAMMCKEIGTMYVPISAEKKTMFKNKLINQCQVEFERHKDDSKLRNRTEKMKEIENEKNTEKRDELKAIFDEEDFKLRKRAVGTVKFIGELYKIDMLTSKIMRSCVGVLLGEDIISEDTLECLCKLLTTIGQKMEKQEDLQDNFNKLRSIIDKKQQKISSRIRFMIQDVIDLRKNNWTPRRADLKPKTIEQIQKDVENEQFNNQMLNYQSSQQRKDDNRRGGNSGQNNYNKRMGGGGGGGGGDDAWLTQQNSKRSAKLIDMKNITINSNLEPKTMGSPSLFQSFNCYNALAAAGDDVGPQNENNKREAYNSKGSSMERDRGDMRGGDRGYYTGDRYGSQSGGRNSNQGSRNGSQIRSRDNSGSRAGNMAAGGSRSLQPPPHRHQQSSSSSSQTLMSSSGNIVRSGSQYKDQPQQQQQQQQQQPQKTSMPPPQIQKQSSVENKGMMMQKQPPMSAAEVTKSTTAVSNIIKNLKDRLSAEDALDKMSGIRMNVEVLTEAYNLLLDRRDQERYIFCEIMTQLIRKNTVSNDDNIQALKASVDQAKDLICDLPHIYLYIAQFLAIYVCENILSCKDIFYICESECSSENGGDDILQKLFKTIENKYDKKRLCEVFENANVDLKLFIANKDINHFLGKYDFEYLLNKEVVKPQPITDVNQISAEIKRLLKRQAEFDNIFDWINTNVESTEDFSFIRTLTTTVIEHCVEKQTMYKLNIPLLHKLLPVLQKYIDNNESLEMQCLYAIQKLIVKLEFPQGLLNNIFSELYDNGVLSSEGFRRWEMSDDPYEQEGKGVILKNCTQFFTMLSEEGESSCEED